MIQLHEIPLIYLCIGSNYFISSYLNLLIFRHL